MYGNSQFAPDCYYGHFISSNHLRLFNRVEEAIVTETKGISETDFGPEMI